VKDNVEAGVAGNVSKGVGDERLADANRAQHDDVALRFDETEAEELLQDAPAGRGGSR
jgi:hypothetical protein